MTANEATRLTALRRSTERSAQVVPATIATLIPEMAMRWIRPVEMRTGTRVPSDAECAPRVMAMSSAASGSGSDRFMPASRYCRKGTIQLRKPDGSGTAVDRPGELHLRRDAFSKEDIPERQFRGIERCL